MIDKSAGKASPPRISTQPDGSSCRSFLRCLRFVKDASDLGSIPPHTPEEMRSRGDALLDLVSLLEGVQFPSSQHERVVSCLREPQAYRVRSGELVNFPVYLVEFRALVPSFRPKAIAGPTTYHLCDHVSSCR